MNKAETLRALIGATRPDDIDRGILINYYKYFGELDDIQRQKLFNADSRIIIGAALTREWEATYSLMEQGYNHVECPIGGKIYRNRRSKRWHYWNSLIKDNMSVSDCKAIFLDIIGKWEGGNFLKTIGGENGKQQGEKTQSNQPQSNQEVDDEIPF